VHGANFDPELMQDFLTESGELLEQLDQDLITLETSPGDLELVNRVFRALHTIKGSASFLALTELVEVAHAAESSLNAARNRVFVIDRPVMDLLLGAVDVIKKQFDNIRADEPLAKAGSELVRQLTLLGEGKKLAPSTTVAAAATASTAPAAGTAPSESHAESSHELAAADQHHADAASSSQPSSTGVHSTPLKLDDSKSALLDFMVSDALSTLDQIDGLVKKLQSPQEAAAVGSTLADAAEALGKSGEFFGVESMVELTNLLKLAGIEAQQQQQDVLAAVSSDCSQMVAMLRDITSGLSQGQVLHLSTEPMRVSLKAKLSGELPHEVTPAPAANPTEHADAAVNPASGSMPAASTHEASPHAADHVPNAGDHGKPVAADQTIRVEVGRLEALLNLVGELVLQKNRVTALGRQLSQQNLGTQDFRESVMQAAGALDRVTGDLQVAVMKTRMQPLEKLFGKYPRLIRDLARKLNKDINLVVEGAQTEVDKSVIEELGDPLIHLMRNSADHGIEMPDARVAAGKPALGTIRLCASHEGSHVQILIADDGKGIDAGFISKKAIDKGVVTQAEVDAMTEREKIMLIFAPGFSTAEKISDVSGRGVGMDVVKTNIEKLKGTIEIETVPGKGTTMRVKIPLTVAIMSAMMVAVGKEIYAVPLTSITEIVKPGEAQVSTIRGRRVMRLRDEVLPLLDAADLLNVPKKDLEERPFAVVLTAAEKRVGLLVSRLIGQQEVVIKPLDAMKTDQKAGPVSGATVRDDGGVSLIVDVPRLFALADGSRDL
jgi:two-component system, chemotaxis family, sensor kinase CheA